jgi:hypothetical protein
MDDNIWEYPFGDIEDDDDGLFRSQNGLKPSEDPHRIKSGSAK